MAFWGLSACVYAVKSRSLARWDAVAMMSLFIDSCVRLSISSTVLFIFGHCIKSKG